MDYYQIWCNLIDSHNDLEFCENVRSYLGHLQSQGLISGFTITRRKLGFGPAELGEFNITIKTESLAKLEETFQHVAARGGETERLHRLVYSAITDFRSALYRDFPDPVRLPTGDPK